MKIQSVRQYVYVMAIGKRILLFVTLSDIEFFPTSGFVMW